MEFSKEQKAVNLQYVKDEKKRIEEMAELLGQTLISPRKEEFTTVLDILVVWNRRLSDLTNKNEK